MPVFSYLAIPVAGHMQTLRNELESLPGCSVIAAENREVLVLVTDTPDDETEKELQHTLKSLQSLQSLSMTYGHGDERQPEHETRQS